MRTPNVAQRTPHSWLLFSSVSTVVPNRDTGTGWIAARRGRRGKPVAVTAPLHLTVDASALLAEGMHLIGGGGVPTRVGIHRGHRYGLVVISED